MNIGYVRVSTIEQNDGRQIEALAKHNIEKWFKEKVSAVIWQINLFFESQIILA